MLSRQEVVERTCKGRGVLANTGIVNAWELYGCEEETGVIGVGALSE